MRFPGSTVRRVLRVLPAFLLAGTALALAAPAQAAFPGENGKIAYAGNGGTSREIYTINPDGSDSRRLTNDDVYDGYPQWSPDGRRIAWCHCSSSNSEIYVMESDGSGLTNLTNNPASDRDPAWSPDGSRIAFTSNRDGGTEIYTMRSDGSDVRRLTNSSGSEANLSWSPDGDRLAFDRGFDCNIWAMSSDGGGEVRLTNLDPAFSCAGAPDWSPSGAEIVFVYTTCVDWGEQDPCPGISVMDADGSNIRALSCCGVVSPAWSPDGSQIAYVACGAYLPPGYCRNDIRVMRSDGTQHQPLVEDGDQPSWQPIPLPPSPYPRPTGATPLRVPLVPAFESCEAGPGGVFLSQHGGGLPVKNACPNSALSSSTARLGGSTPGGTRTGFATSIVCTTTAGAGCSMVTSVPDVRLFGNGSDIVCAIGAALTACPGGPGSDYDPNPNAGPYTSGLDPGTNSNKAYPGPICNPTPPNPANCATGADMTAVATIPDSTSSSDRAIRVTDQDFDTWSNIDPVGCDSSTSCSGTARDQGFLVPVVCKANSDPSIGSYCGANTTANALVPGVVVGGKAAVVEIGEIQVYDSGPDGVRANSDDELFAVQGIFVP